MLINVWQRRLTTAVSACLILVGCGLAACSSSGGDSGTANTGNGQAIVSMTDAAGDFLSYTVDVESLTLAKQNGAVVETLPLKTRVNFADYVEMTEFFTAATIPSGTYTSARMRLNFSAADVQVEDLNGNAAAVPAANIRDANGNPLAILDVEVKFDDLRTLFIAPGIPAHLTLDFNLQASNTADLTVNPPVVTVKPFLVADVDPQKPKTMRLRGPLKSVNEQSQSYEVFLRPFYRNAGDFGALTVHIDSSTVFEIDEVNYQGGGGLTALSAKTAGTATVAIGQWKSATKEFKADEVLADSSVPGGTRDVVVGDVIARSGDQLTVKGASLLRSDGTFTFHDTITVNIGASTKVRRQAVVTTGLSKDDISVGQRIAAFGALDGSNSTLDATHGLVRLLVTSVAGTVNSAGTGALEMAVQRIDGRRVALFNFAGTGTSPTADANPAHYQVSTGAVDLSGLTAGTPVRVLGFPTKFKTAPPDFTAQTVVNLTNRAATLLINWRPPTAAPFSAATDSGFLLNLAGVGAAHHVWRGPVAMDLLTVGQPVNVAPDTSAAGLFALGANGTVQVFTQFPAYRLAIEDQLSQGRLANTVGAHGLYDDTSATITADQIYSVLQ